MWRRMITGQCGNVKRTIVAYKLQDVLVTNMANALNVDVMRLKKSFAEMESSNEFHTNPVQATSVEVRRCYSATALPI